MSTALAAQRSEPIGEMIGRVAASTRVWMYGPTLSADFTRTDYAYWDKLHRGKLPTLRLGGLFAKPMTEHVRSWALGGGFKGVTDHKPTDEALADFVNQNMRTVLRVVKTMLELGDAYLVINADGTLTEVNPDLVDVVTDPYDYRRVLGYRITTTLEKVTVVDEYSPGKRMITIKEGGKEVRKTFSYRLLGDRMPVVHFAHEKGVNEIFGHPMVEALLSAFLEYDDVLDKSLKGVKAMGTPFPVMEKVTNVEKALQDLGARSTTFEDANGDTQTAQTVDFEALNMIITEGEFNLKGPAPFTDDSWRVLKNLFLLFLQHGNIPEWVWGGAIASSKASVEAQMPAFSKFIEAIQESLAEPLGALCELWLAVTALYTPTVRALPVQISYPPVAIEDKAHRLATIKQAREDGLITKVTELRLLDLVEDPEAEVEAAQAEAEEAQAAFDARVGAGDDMATAARDEANAMGGGDEDEEDDERAVA
jgi:hypothetical protein